MILKKTFILIFWLLKQLKRIPFGALILYIVSDLCVFIFDKIFITIGSFVAICKGKGELKRYWKRNAYINDVKLSVSGEYILNATLRHKNNPSHLKFGHPFHSISDIMGRLRLTKFGKWCDDKFLDTIEKRHIEKAVELNNAALIKRVKELNILKK